jgi:hypothetical protein
LFSVLEVRNPTPTMGNTMDVPEDTLERREELARCTAGMACGMDRDGQEPKDADERVLKSVYDSTCSVAQHPLYMARSAPHDFLSPLPTSPTSPTYSDAAQAKEVGAFFDRYLCIKPTLYMVYTYTLF